MKKEGDRYICRVCQVEVHVIKINYQGEEKLSHRNADGSAHYFFNEETKQFEHTPTKSTEYDIRFDEMDERLRSIERQLGIVRVE